MSNSAQNNWTNPVHLHSEKMINCSVILLLSDRTTIEAKVFRHEPCGDRPELWEPELISNDPSLFVEQEDGIVDIDNVIGFCVNP